MHSYWLTNKQAICYASEAFPLYGFQLSGTLMGIFYRATPVFFVQYSLILPPVSLTKDLVHYSGHVGT